MSLMHRLARHYLAPSTILALALGCDTGVSPFSPPGAPSEALLFPPCVAPLGVPGTIDWRNPGFIVTYRPGTDPVAETSRLAVRYSFAPRHVYHAIPGFAADLTREAVRGLRCEATVLRIASDGVAGFATNP